MAVRPPFRLLAPSILLGFLLSFAQNSRAQNITAKETIAYLNGKLEGKYSFKDKKSYVLVSVWKRGEVIREDKLYLNDLDPDGIKFSEEEQALIVPCQSGKPDCIPRKIIHLKKMDNYSRISFLIAEKDEVARKGIEAALVHLLKLTHYSDHQRTEPFE